MHGTAFVPIKQGRIIVTSLPKLSPISGLPFDVGLLTKKGGRLPYLGVLDRLSTVDPNIFVIIGA